MRRLFELIATVARKNNRFLFVNGELRKDLVTWQTFLCNYNCLTFYRLVDPFVDTNIVIESDASNIGFGLVYGSVWIQGYYPAECSAIDFNTRELYPVLVINSLWALGKTNEPRYRSLSRILGKPWVKPS